MIAKHHEDRWTKLVSNWNPAISTKKEGDRKQGRPTKRWEDDLNSILTTRPELTEKTTTSRATRPGFPRHKMARTWNSCGKTDFYEQQTSSKQHDSRPQSPTRLRQPNQQHTSKQRTRLTRTTKTKTTPKTTALRYSSSLNRLIIEPPQNQDNGSKDTRPKSSNQDFSRHPE